MSTTADLPYTTFYAVAVKDPSETNEFSVEKCFYFDTNWRAVASSSLQAATGQDIVRIQQRKQVPDPVVGYIHTQGFEVNSSVGLFSAVAKTLKDTAFMPNNFMSSDDSDGPFVTITVSPGTSRGVILIFQYPATGGPEQIIATTDPEVKSGSSN